MKFKTLTAAVFALTVAASPSFAGASWLGVNAGLNVPTGVFGDIASLGYFGGVTGSMMINDNFGVGADINFHSFGVNNDYEEALAVDVGESVDVSLSSIQMTPHIIYMFPTSGDFKPYAKLGLGFYNSKVKVEAATLGSQEDSQSDFGFNLGVGGLKQASEKMAYGVELLYHSIQSDGESIALFTVGGVLKFGMGN